MRVLVVHGSSRGGTEGLARMVADALVAQGVTADIGAAAAVDDLEPYDGVVVGGALYHGRWHHDAARFVEHHLGELRSTQVWFFSSGPLDDSARSGAIAPEPQVRELGRRADIRGHMTFGGVLEHHPAGFLGSLLAWGKPGDFRDLEHVAEWVGRIVTQLGMPPATAGTVVDNAVRTASHPAKTTESQPRRESPVTAGTPHTSDEEPSSQQGRVDGAPNRALDRFADPSSGGGILHRLVAAGTAGEDEDEEDLGLDVLSD